MADLPFSIFENHVKDINVIIEKSKPKTLAKIGMSVLGGVIGLFSGVGIGGIISSGMGKSATSHIVGHGMSIGLVSGGVAGYYSLDYFYSPDLRHKVLSESMQGFSKVDATIKVKSELSNLVKQLDEYLRQLARIYA